MRRHALFIAPLLIAAIFATHASAQKRATPSSVNPFGSPTTPGTADDRCGLDNPFSTVLIPVDQLQKQIAICSRLIASRTLSNQELASAYYNRAGLHQQKKELDLAILDLNQAIRLKPEDAIAYRDRGVIYDDKGDSDRAIADFSVAIKLDPSSVDFFYQRALVYEKRNDYDHAIADLTEAVQTHSFFKPAYFSKRATVYEKRNNFEQALADFREALRLGQDTKKDIERIEFQLATAVKPSLSETPVLSISDDDRSACDKLPLPDYEPVIAACSRLIGSGTLAGTELAKAHQKRGIAYIQKGDLDRAIADFSETIRADANFADAYGSRAGSYLRKGDFDRAIADYSQAIRLPETKSTWSVYWGRGKAYYAKTDYDHAIADYNEAIRRSERFLASIQASQLYADRALTYEKKGDLDRALTDFSTAVSANPDLKLASDGVRRIEQRIANSSQPVETGKPVAAIANKPPPKLSANTQLPQLRGTPQSSFDYKITFTNESDRKLNVNLAADTPLTFESNFTEVYNSQQITSVMIEPGGSRDIVLHLRPPSSVDPGKYTISVTGSAEDISVKTEVVLDIARPTTQATVTAPTPPIPAVAALVSPPTVTPATIPAIPVVPGRRVALVIGNNDYENVPKLEKAVNDARTIGDHLARLGFEVIRGENVTRRAMNSRIIELEGKIGRGNSAFFFFAGHGVALNGSNYLLATDTPTAAEGQEDFIAREGIEANSIIEALQARGAKVTLLVLDACRDNPFKTLASRGIGGTRGLTELKAPEGVFVLYSAGIGQTALDRLSDADGNPNSVFTRTFATFLDRPELSLQDVAKETQTAVRKLAATVNHLQMPAYYDQIDGRLALGLK